MQRRAILTQLAALTSTMFLVSCGGGGKTEVIDVIPNSGTFNWSLPAFFPAPKVPADNPMSTAKVDLGRHLFYDVKLSGNGKQSCASCHQQDKAFTDGKAVSTGSTGEKTERNSQSLANVVYSPTLTWANPSLVSLERQMEVPLFSEHPVEMGVNDSNKNEILTRFSTNPSYQAKFKSAFPEETSPVSWINIIRAISSFQRSIISGNSRYDQFLAGKAKLNDAELRGMNLFNGEKAECFHCHGSFNFNNQTIHAASTLVETPFHNTGLYNIDGKGAYPTPNRGVFELSGLATDMGKFRAPSLRNVAVTAPYMHDGSIATLDEVVSTYAAGGRNITSGPHAGDGRNNPYKDELITRISLTEQEIADLVAFLKTLTDDTLLTDPKLANPFTQPALP